MGVKAAPDWTPTERLQVAGLIVDPATNGGMWSEVTAEQIADTLPEDAPAWGVWEEGRAVFVVGCWPFKNGRGCLHLAGDRTLNHTQHLALVRAFLSCMEGVEVFTVTTSPALVRLARQVGLELTGEQGGVYTLERASR